VTPPVGFTNVRSSTGDLPDELGALPCVVTILDGGDFRTGGGTREGGHDFLTRFYYSESIDVARDMVALRKWLTVLVDQLKASTQLGGIVTSARVMGWRAGVMKYAGRDYSGIELRIHVVTSEGWAATA
jgi:hypothetical protein